MNSIFVEIMAVGKIEAEEEQCLCNSTYFHKDWKRISSCLEAIESDYPKDIEDADRRNEVQAKDTESNEPVLWCRVTNHGDKS